MPLLAQHGLYLNDSQHPAIGQPEAIAAVASSLVDPARVATDRMAGAARAARTSYTARGGTR